MIVGLAVDATTIAALLVQANSMKIGLGPGHW
jgi:hypothetical protein